MKKQQLWGVIETEQAMEERDVHIGDEITAYIPSFDSVKAKSKRKKYITKKTESAWSVQTSCSPAGQYRESL